MNKTEKVGLIEAVTGIVFLAAMFVIGHGNPAAAKYPNGEPMPALIAVAMIIVGMWMFVWGGE